MIQYYYPETTYGITVALLDMWNDIEVRKYDAYGNVVSAFNLPITFGPIEKTHQMRKEAESGKRYYIQTPRAALVFNGVTFAAGRAKSLSYERLWNETNLSGVQQIFTDYEPPPYDYLFSLYIWTEGMRDLAQILENICPYFHPKNTLRVREFSFLNIERDLPVHIGSIGSDFTDDLDENSMRQLKVVLDITVEGFMYKPIATSKLVKYVNSRYFTEVDDPTVQFSAYTTTGHYATSAFPSPDEYNTSGFNAGSGIYWTKQPTFSADV